MGLVKIKTIAFSWALLVVCQSCLNIGHAIELDLLQNMQPIEITGNWNRSLPSLEQEEKTIEGQSRLVSKRQAKLPCTHGNWLQPNESHFYPTDYITYEISTSSRTISDEEIKAAIENATAAWSLVTPLIFVNVDENADITFTFGRPDGCNYTIPILSCTVVYNHVSSNSNYNYSIVRLNDSVDWFYGDRDEMARDNNKSHNLVCTAIHEIGHALGLTHSCKSVIMYPVMPNSGQCELIVEDEERIQKVYGSPTKNHRYFYNEEKASFMTAPNCAEADEDSDSDCPDVQIGKPDDAQPWEVFTATKERGVQIRSTADKARCAEASDDGQVTLANCTMGEKAQLWRRDGYIGMEDTIFTNAETQQVLYADCDNDAVCTKATDDPEVDEKYERWKLSANLESLEPAGDDDDQ